MLIAKKPGRSARLIKRLASREILSRVEAPQVFNTRKSETEVEERERERGGGREAAAAGL